MRQRLSEMLQTAATDALEQRVKPVEALADDAEQVAAACHAMAIRFHRGGKLICFGSGGPSTDAQHIAVEFVHPVIVGKQALPAISLTGDVATLTSIAGREGYAEVYAHQLRYLAAPTDIALGVSVDGNDPAVLAGLEAAAELGMLTIALAGGDGGQTAHQPGRPRAGRPLRRPPGRQGGPRHRLPRPLGAGARPVRAAGRARPGGDPVSGEVPACYGDVCITCSDEAVEVRVVRLLTRPVVDTGQSMEEVSVALVDVAVGDTILVHAKEAIAVVGGAAGGS